MNFLDKLLNEQEKRFLQSLDSVKTEILPNNEISNEVVGKIEKSFTEQILFVAKNLNDMIEQVSTGKDAYFKFINNYQNWSEKRNQVNAKLLEIAELLRKDKKNCNISKLVGNSTSFVGGGLLLASAILIPFTAGLSAPLGIAGGAIMAAGSSTSVGTSVTERIRIKQYRDEALKIVTEDFVYFEGMKPWLENTRKLKEAEAEIMDVETVKAIIPFVKKLVNKGKKIENDEERIKYIEKKIRKITKRLPEILGYDVPVVAIVTFISLLSGVILLFANAKNRFIFDCASLTAKSLTGAVVLADELFDVGMAVAGNVVKGAAKAAIRGSFAAFGMTIDAIQIILTSIDIHKGSVSPEAEKICDLVNKLKQESDQMQNVYNSLMEHEPRGRSID